MRPGIVVQHARLPDRSSELVRGDIAAIIGFIEKRRWPADATAGDMVELVLRRDADLWAHPDRKLFDPASRRAVRGFFANGGDTCHLFGVCISSEEDLKTPAACLGVFAPLFDRLRAEDDVALLLVPAAAYMDCTWDARKGEVRADAEVLYDQLLAHCREMTNRFLIMDAPRGLHGEPLLKWMQGFRARRTETRSYGAVYYPWLMEGDEVFPPSGSVAGTYARVELDHAPYGTAWPPANVPVRGVTHTDVDLSWEEAGELAELAVNPLIVQPGRGVIAFGARTLSRDPVFRHVNARRVVNMVTEQLRRDSEWAVFETNNPHLWDVLERDVLFRLGEFAGAGMLTGKVAGEDYNAQCDAETNIPALRDAGQVNVRIRMRPVGTVEHIVVDLRIGDDSAAGGT
jgi:uncharacterized protein